MTMNNEPPVGNETVAEREMPRPNEAETRDGNRRMSTADLAYGRDTRRVNGVARDNGEEHPTLIRDEDASGFRDRWMSIQTHFIDEPQDTVADADELVAEVIQSLASRFAEERANLEHQWRSGSEVSTEDLRQAMQRYRSFFERLLAA